MLGFHVWLILYLQLLVWYQLRCMLLFCSLKHNKVISSNLIPENNFIYKALWDKVTKCCTSKSNKPKWKELNWDKTTSHKSERTAMKWQSERWKQSITQKQNKFVKSLTCLQEEGLADSVALQRSSSMFPQSNNLQQDSYMEKKNTIFMTQ